MRLLYRNREELELQVVVHRQKGWSIHKLANAAGISRPTVRKILRKHKVARDQGHSLVVAKTTTPRATKLDTYVKDMQKLLTDFPDILGKRMFEELQAKGYDGGITQLRDRLRAIRPRPARRPHVRFETEAGKQGQMDWSPFTVPLVGGGTLDVLCFSYILAHSRRHFIDFTPRRDFFTLIRRHVDAFNHFGGVPETCLYDGEKTVILRWEARQAIFNPKFLVFITHYRCRPIGCGPRRPQTKGKVEEPFKYVLSSLLNARKFRDLEDLREGARWWMANRSDLHKHDTTGRPPLELFLEREQAALQPLPRHDYDTAEVHFCVGDGAGFVELETNFYSVPYHHIGDILTVKASEKAVVIYSPDLHTIAEHPRKPDGARHRSELPEHRKDPRVKYGIAPVRPSFELLGKSASAFLAGLERRHPRNGGFHARRILVLRERYHSDDIHKALQHALRFEAFDASAVERILRARARPRTLEETTQHRASERLRESLPRIPQRPLSEYQRFLARPSSPENAEEKEDPDGEETQEA